MAKNSEARRLKLKRHRLTTGFIQVQDRR